MAVAWACLEAWPTSALHPLEHKLTDALIIQASALSANENSRTVQQDNNEQADPWGYRFVVLRS
jgi:hypothetical protein